MTVLLVGCGRMGGALARGWCGTRRVLAYDPGMAGPVPGVERVRTLDGVCADQIVLAVKPQVFASVAPDLVRSRAGDPLIVSIMAGVTLAGLAAALRSSRIVRAMPNTPAAIGRGITAAVAGPDVSEDDIATVDTLLSVAGEVVWLDDEAQVDAVTAVSGSGPAYFFRFAEALAAAGAQAGLPPALGIRLARATFTGAAALAEAEAADLAELRRQVTSPGGTTAAGLDRMDRDGAIDTLARAVVAAAAARSRELAR